MKSKLTVSPTRTLLLMAAILLWAICIALAVSAYSAYGAGNEQVVPRNGNEDGFSPHVTALIVGILAVIAAITATYVSKQSVRQNKK